MQIKEETKEDGRPDLVQSWDNNDSTFTHREIEILYVLLSVDLLLLEVVTPEIKTDLKYPRHSNLHCHHDSDCIIYKQVIQVSGDNIYLMLS